MSACASHIPLESLSERLDGRPLPEAAEHHLAHCSACRGQLEGLRAQARALSQLASPGTSSPVGRRTPARGLVLGAARDAAWSHLLQILHELFMACARIDPGVAFPASPQVVGPRLARPVPRIAADLACLARRLDGLGVQLDLSTLPRDTPPVAVAIEAAETVLALIRRLEPDSPRQQMEHGLLRAARRTSAP